MAYQELVLLLATVIGLACCNNYQDQALSIEYAETVIPTFGTLNGTVTELDSIEPTIKLNRTDAILNCSSGYMNIKLNFKQPFFGIVYADYDRNSACKISGNGKLSETIKLPLKGCGTLQRPARVFTNNIIVRFHPGLEIDGDEVITVVCRYPSPIAKQPVKPEGLQVPRADSPTRLQPLREFEILLIICAIIFLALMLLGIGCSYYCLKKRNIKVTRRRPTSTLGSDITKLSEPVVFDGLKIPRVHAVDTSGSEENAESIRTDFPSDVTSIESEEDYTSAYSDKTCVLSEGALVHALRNPPVPHFDINLLIKQKLANMTPVPSDLSSESETVVNAQEQYLTTILERTETNTLETLERQRKAKMSTGPPPVHARLNIKKKEFYDESTTDTETMSEFSQGTDLFSEQEMELEAKMVTNRAISGRQYQSKEENEVAKIQSSGYKVEEHSYNNKHASGRKHAPSLSRQEEGSNNFDVLIRIFSENTMNVGDTSDTSSVFNVEERHVIKEVLQEDTNMISELRSTYNRDDIKMLQDHSKISSLVEPEKWDVFIRILQHAETFDKGDAASSTTSFGQQMPPNCETLSVADRSGTEITEYHHYQSYQASHWQN